MGCARLDRLLTSVVPLAACATVLLTSPARAADPDQYPASVGQRFDKMNPAPVFNVEGWHVEISGSVRTGYDDNIAAAAVAPESSPEIELRGGVKAARDIGPHTLTANAALARIWYPDSSHNNDTEAVLGAAAALRLQPGLVLRGTASAIRGREQNELANGIVVNGVFDPYTERAEFHRLPMEAGIDYDFGHWFFGANADLGYVEFDPQVTRSGLTIDQGFRNGWETELRARAAYEFHPSLSLFGEIAADRGRHDDPNGDDEGWRIVGGGQLEFQHLLVGNAYAGYASKSFSTGGEVDGLTFGASLNWYADELVSFTLDAKREFRAEQVTTLVGVTSAVPLVHDAIALRAEYEPLRQVLVFAEVGYARDDRESVNRTDGLTKVTVGGTYVVTRDLRLNFEYEHADGTSDFAGDHERNRVSVGLTAFY